MPFTSNNANNTKTIILFNERDIFIILTHSQTLLLAAHYSSQVDKLPNQTLLLATILQREPNMSAIQQSASNLPMPYAFQTPMPNIAKFSAM
jgi:hypothetical protein